MIRMHVATVFGRRGTSQPGQGTDTLSAVLLATRQPLKPKKQPIPGGKSACPPSERQKLGTFGHGEDPRT